MGQNSSADWEGLDHKDQDKNKDLTHKDQGKDKDLAPKDQDKDKDLTTKDQDKDKDLKNVLKESLRTRTRTRINIPALTRPEQFARIKDLFRGASSAVLVSLSIAAHDQSRLGPDVHFGLSTLPAVGFKGFTIEDVSCVVDAWIGYLVDIIALRLYLGVVGR